MVTGAQERAYRCRQAQARVLRPTVGRGGRCCCQAVSRHSWLKQRVRDLNGDEARNRMATVARANPRTERSGTSQ
jgi:hypothetical protein